MFPPQHTLSNRREMVGRYATHHNESDGIVIRRISLQNTYRHTSPTMAKSDRTFPRIPLITTKFNRNGQQLWNENVCQTTKNVIISRPSRQRLHPDQTRKSTVDQQKKTKTYFCLITTGPVIVKKKTSFSDPMRSTSESHWGHSQPMQVWGRPLIW